MNEGVYAFVDGLRRGRLSRNRQFAAFESPDGRRAQRVQRRLTALERELLAPGVVVTLARIAGGRFALRMEQPAVKLVRTAYLGREELTFLCEHPRVRDRLTVYLSR